MPENPRTSPPISAAFANSLAGKATRCIRRWLDKDLAHPVKLCSRLAVIDRDSYGRGDPIRSSVAAL